MQSSEERDADPRPANLDVTSEWSQRVACLGVLFHIVTMFEDITGQPTSVVNYECSIPETVEVALHAVSCEPYEIDEVIRGVKFVTRLSETQFKISCSYGGHGLDADTLSLEAVKLFLKGYGELLTSWSSLPLEHFLVVGWNGVAVAGEGSESRITVPVTRAAVFAHTHPRGSFCIPSYKDIETAAGFLAEGGIAEVVVSQACTFVLRLRKPLTEDDYWALLDASRRLKKVKDASSAYRILSSLNSRSVETLLTSSPLTL